MSESETIRKRVLGIVGSPRHGGNTEVLVDEALRGAEEAGALVEKIVLSKLDITPCQGCDVCLDTGECIYKDDMPELLEKMQNSQVWVLGTPIYWWGPTAQFKTFVDRWYSAVAKGPATFKGPRVILIIPCDEAHTARHTVAMLTDILASIKAELLATVLVGSVFKRGKVREHPNALADAHRAGWEAVAK